MAAGAIIGTGIGLAFLADIVFNRLAKPGQRRRQNLLNLAQTPSGFGDLRSAISEEQQLSDLIGIDKAITSGRAAHADSLFGEEEVLEQMLRSQLGELMTPADFMQAGTVASGGSGGVQLMQLMARAGIGS